MQNLLLTGFVEGVPREVIEEEDVAWLPKPLCVAVGEWFGVDTCESVLLGFGTHNSAMEPTAAPSPATTSSDFGEALAAAHRLGRCADGSRENGLTHGPD